MTIRGSRKLLSKYRIAIGELLIYFIVGDTLYIQRLLLATFLLRESLYSLHLYQGSTFNYTYFYSYLESAFLYIYSAIVYPRQLSFQMLYAALQHGPDRATMWHGYTTPVGHYKRGPQRTLLQILRQARQYKLQDSYTRVQERPLLYRPSNETVVVLSTPTLFPRTTPQSVASSANSQIELTSSVVRSSYDLQYLITL